MRNEPNLAQAQADAGGNCAKQSQTWDDWGMWAKAAVVWAAARPGANAPNEPNWAQAQAAAGGILQNKPNLGKEEMNVNLVL